MKQGYGPGRKALKVGLGLPLAVRVIGILGQNGILITSGKHPLEGMYHTSMW